MFLLFQIRFHPRSSMKEVGHEQVEECRVCKGAQSERNLEEEGRGLLEDQRVGPGPREACELGFLMRPHLGRLWREAPLTTARPIQSVLPTCPLLCGVLARHREAISGPGSSVKRKEREVERGQNSHPGAPSGGLEEGPARDGPPHVESQPGACSG